MDRRVDLQECHLRLDVGDRRVVVMEYLHLQLIGVDQEALPRPLQVSVIVVAQVIVHQQHLLHQAALDLLRGICHHGTPGHRLQVYHLHLDPHQ